MAVRPSNQPLLLCYDDSAEILVSLKYFPDRLKAILIELRRRVLTPHSCDRLIVKVGFIMTDDAAIGQLRMYFVGLTGTPFNLTS